MKVYQTEFFLFGEIEKKQKKKRNSNCHKSLIFALSN